MTITKQRLGVCGVMMGLCVALPQVSAAASYENVFVTPTDPEAYTVVDEPYLMRAYHGVLNGFPHTYKLVLESAQDVTFTLVLPRHLSEPVFSLLMVKQQGQDVEEIWRQSSAGMSWEKDYVAKTGDTYLVGETYTELLLPGTYYVEVSNGDNEGAYVMRFGFDPVPYNRGYGDALHEVAATKDFFGKTILSAWWSPYYYVPTFLLLLAWWLWGVYRRRG